MRLLLNLDDTLNSLISAHKLATEVWVIASVAVDACERGTEEHAAASAEEATLRWREQETLNDLLAYRPADLGEVLTRMEYLVGTAGPWDGCVPQERELDVFFGSMVGENAA